MENVDKVKKKRTTHRRNVTKIVNKVDELLKTDPVDKRKLKHYQNELIEKRSDLKDLDNEILELLTEHADEQTADKEMDDALEYKERLSCALISIEEALEKLKLPNIQRSDSRESLASIGSLSSIGSQGKRVNVKLPKLELRKFNGKIYEWQEFWDVFVPLYTKTKSWPTWINSNISRVSWKSLPEASLQECPLLMQNTVQPLIC